MSSVSESEAGSTVALDRRRLAECLSRISSARGVGISVRRFEILVGQFFESRSGGLNVCAEWVWAEQYPDGSATEIELVDVESGDLPALIFGGSATVSLLVGSSRGQLVGLNEEGERVPLDAATISGKPLVLEIGRTADSDKVLPRPDSGDWFRAAFRTHRGLYRDVVMASFVVSLLGLVAAIYTMQVYDRVVPTGAFSTLIVLTVGVAISIALEAVGRQLKTVLIDQSSDQIDRRLGELFFTRAMSLRMESRPGSVGTLASQIKGYETVRQYMTASLLFVFSDLPFAVIFLFVIWALAGPLALIPLAVIPVGIGIGLFLRGPIERYTKMNAEETNKRNGLLIETLDGAEVMKALGAEWELGRRWRSLTDRIALGDLKVRLMSYSAVNAGQALQQVTYVAIVAAGAYLVTVGEITVGALIACSMLSGRTLGALSQFPRLVVQSKQAKIALAGLDQMMSIPNDEDSDALSLVPDTVDGSIRLEGVVFGYDQSRPLLAVSSLSIAPGERVAVLGASGSGKSTLVRLLSGLYRPGHGRVFLGGHDMGLLPQDYVREVVAYVPQDIRLFSGTLRDNLILGLPAPTESSLSQACDLTGLSEVIAGHPLGLGLPINEGGLGLSVGQRQLVALTRAVLARPRVLLLDEPSASLDSGLERRVLENIFGGCGPETSVVLVTHKLSVLDHCERILVVDQGQVVLDGPRAEVLDRLSGPAEGGVE